MSNSKKQCKECKQWKPIDELIKHPIGTFCDDNDRSCVIAFTQKAQNRARAKQQTKARREQQDKDKAARIKHKADLKRVRKTPRAEALELAQLLARVSAADDNGYCSCASCGVVLKWNEMDGGHFIAKGDSSYWALDQRNIWPQCKPCNGNGMKYGTAAITYTSWMVARFGQAFVDEMIEARKTVVKRSSLFYDEFIESTKKEISSHKRRIGA